MSCDGGDDGDGCGDMITVCVPIPSRQKHCEEGSGKDVEIQGPNDRSSTYVKHRHKSGIGNYWGNW